MNKTLQKALIALILIVCFELLVGLYFYSQTFGINTRQNNASLTAQLNEGHIDSLWLKTLSFERIKINSDFEYQLDGIMLYCNDSTKNTIIVCHGVGANKYGMFKVAPMYLELGFNVLLFDSRAHGESGGENYSFGYYEKDDLEQVVKYIKKEFLGGKIGIHGESMGAATCLLHAGKYNSVDFYIEDCGYSDLKKLLNYRLKEDYGIPNTLILESASIITKIKDGYYFGQISPLESIINLQTPILFIHGLEDDYVPTFMGEEMYKKYEAPKSLLLVKEAEHAASYTKAPLKYKHTVHDFLKTNKL